jgi:hypothetical protein
MIRFAYVMELQAVMQCLVLSNAMIHHAHFIYEGGSESNHNHISRSTLARIQFPWVLSRMI